MTAAFLALGGTVTGLSPAAFAATPPAGTAAVATSDPAVLLTEEELEKLVAPIALYPDDLVSLIVAASIYPVQIVEADRFLEQRKAKPDLKPNNKWDGSVIALLNYPPLVKMMSEDLTWTQQLADAVVNQEKDLLAAIQQLREEAQAKGILKSNDKVVVEEEDDDVVIRSADPDVVYIPEYPPEMFYEPGYAWVEPYYSDYYPSYLYPTAPWWPALITGIFWGSWVDWDDGWWGGDIDADIDIDGDFDFDIGDIRDRPRVEHHDFRDFDRSKLQGKDFKIDRARMEQGLRNNRDNKVADRAKDRPSSANRMGAGNVKGKDIRTSVETGLAKQKQLPKPGSKVAGSGGGTPKVADRAAGSAKPKAGTKMASSGGRKPGATAKARSKQPSALGSPSAGRVAQAHSNRGQVSRVAHAPRPTPSFSRGGGGGPSFSRGGGGRGGGFGGGGRGGGGRGGGRR
jgi:hypothetical protein